MIGLTDPHPIPKKAVNAQEYVRNSSLTKQFNHLHERLDEIEDRLKQSPCCLHYEMTVEFSPEDW